MDRGHRTPKKLHQRRCGRAHTQELPQSKKTSIHSRTPEVPMFQQRINSDNRDNPNGSHIRRLDFLGQQGAYSKDPHDEPHRKKHTFQTGIRALSKPS